MRRLSILMAYRWSKPITSIDYFVFLILEGFSRRSISSFNSFSMKLERLLCSETAMAESLAFRRLSTLNVMIESLATGESYRPGCLNSTHRHSS